MIAISVSVIAIIHITIQKEFGPKGGSRLCSRVSLESSALVSIEGWLSGFHSVVSIVCVQMIDVLLTSDCVV